MPTSRTSQLGSLTSQSTARRMLPLFTTMVSSISIKNASKRCVNLWSKPDSHIESTNAEEAHRNGYPLMHERRLLPNKKSREINPRPLSRSMQTSTNKESKPTRLISARIVSDLPFHQLTRIQILAYKPSRAGEKRIPTNLLSAAASLSCPRLNQDKKRLLKAQRFKQPQLFMIP